MENLLDVAAEMILKKATEERGIGGFTCDFTCGEVPMRVLDRVFPHEASDSAHLHVLREWAPKSKPFKPDEKAIELMRRIDPTQIQHERLRFALGTMNTQLFEWLPFKIKVLQP